MLIYLRPPNGKRSYLKKIVYFVQIAAVWTTLIRVHFQAPYSIVNLVGHVQFVEKLAQSLHRAFY